MVNAHRREHFQAFGTSFDVVASYDELIAAVWGRASLLGWRPSQPNGTAVEYTIERFTSKESLDSPVYRLACDGETIQSTSELDALLDAFEGHAKIQTAARASGLLFVHAGVVAWRGRGILIPGRSHAGKSTLVHALLRAGAEYYSDEFALLDQDGRVHPYPLPLSLRGDRGAPARRIRAETLGAATGQSATSIDIILATQYRPRARWRPQPISKGEAFLLLMENTVAARQPPAQTMPILRQAVVRATAWQSWRGDARVAARQFITSLAK